VKALRKRLDAMAPAFEPGGRWERFAPLYEITDTILFTPSKVTRTASHVRDALDLKRMMMAVVIALVPCALMACYNTGYQSHEAISWGAEPLDTWQSRLYLATGLGLNPSNVLACTLHGAAYFLPLLFVTFAVGGAIEVTSAILRQNDVNEGFLVTGLLIPLTLPPAIPLWQVALGVAFGVIFAKEVFGGTGMNFLNPALAVRAFLFFAYPAQMSGDIWTAASFEGVDAISGATLLSQAAVDANALGSASWWDAFVGRIPGSMGETSALACLLGAALLLVTRIASWRTMAGVAAGTLLTSWLLNAVGGDSNPMFAVPFHWHVVLGGWALGTVFMATDPVSAAFTDLGRVLYGTGIGVLTVLIRCANPGYPEGVMLAILFMNVLAPLIDHFIVRANVQRRRRGYARRG
jgi:Na+-transporting NADH:ubiquinone oxidoreductase subunit B